jgi:Tfp pilus assembly protein FimV
LVAVGRSWKPFAAPAAFLLAATVAVLVARGYLRHDSPPTPPPAAHVAKPRPAPPRLYTVKAGDTLAAIAARTHTPLARVQALNPGLHPTALFIGQKIRLR